MIGVDRLGAEVKDNAMNFAGGKSLSQKFDLVCVGRWTVSGETEEPFQDTFRVDLERGAWCRENCSRIYQIASVEPGQIQLSAANEQGQGNSLSIDRVSGKLYGRVRMEGLDSTTFATCKSAPFSGFPETQF